MGPGTRSTSTPARWPPNGRADGAVLARVGAGWARRQHGRFPRGAHVRRRRIAVASADAPLACPRTPRGSPRRRPDHRRRIRSSQPARQPPHRPRAPRPAAPRGRRPSPARTPQDQTQSRVEVTPPRGQEAARRDQAGSGSRPTGRLRPPGHVVRAPVRLGGRRGRGVAVLIRHDHPARPVAGQPSCRVVHRCGAVRVRPSPRGSPGTPGVVATTCPEDPRPVVTDQGPPSRGADRVRHPSHPLPRPDPLRRVGEPVGRPPQQGVPRRRVGDAPPLARPDDDRTDPPRPRGARALPLRAGVGVLPGQGRPCRSTPTPQEPTPGRSSTTTSPANRCGGGSRHVRAQPRRNASASWDWRGRANVAAASAWVTISWRCAGAVSTPGSSDVPSA